MQRKSISGVVMPLGLLFVGAYFTFAAVQGDYGLFRRIQIEAERDVYQAELDALREETADIALLTHRLSDDYLDLDLLEEQARERLGFYRPDEIVLP
ncbi:FtsB family cell division protein [Nioella nitratireducens]|uniref:FtsB family cell division protein n=1 Tax=Nioella nitratireducens TaxID=1287720 RepID=UPI0008FD568F|nr:septum formation initiator family protein [Nioella nitratireducens]